MFANRASRRSRDPSLRIGDVGVGHPDEPQLFDPGRRALAAHKSNERGTVVVHGDTAVPDLEFVPPCVGDIELRLAERRQLCDLDRGDAHVFAISRQRRRRDKDVGDQQRERNEPSNDNACVHNLSARE